MSDAPWNWYIALDGGDLDGLTGDCGLLKFSWPDKKISYRFYDGISGGHNVSISPSGKLLLLGNFSQQLLLIDAITLNLLARVSTMKFQETDFRLRASTHALWVDDSHFIVSIGYYLYLFDIASLDNPISLVKHNMHAAHELRWTNDHRYILLGCMGPEDGVARHVYIIDMLDSSGTPTVCEVTLPGTVWHVAVRQDKPIGYAATYSTISDDESYQNWGPAYTREYIFELDLSSGKIIRTWSAAASFPIHLNSDLDLDGEKFYVASGGSHTVIEIDLDTFSSSKIVHVVPNWWYRLWNWRQRKTNIWGVLARKNPSSSIHMILQTLKVTGNRLFDGVYATRVSPDGKYIAAGNRGYNYIRIMDRELKTVYTKVLPKRNGLHLGMHHSEMTKGIT